MEKLKMYKKEKEVIHKIHLLTGKPYEDVKEVFEGILYMVLLAYLEKEPVYIPFFGEIELKYLKDRYTQSGRVAEIDIDFSPNEFLLRVIGQIEDKEESDIEKFLKNKIHSILKSML